MRLRGDIALEGTQYKGRRTSRTAIFGGSASSAEESGSEAGTDIESAGEGEEVGDGGSSSDEEAQRRQQQLGSEDEDDGELDGLEGLGSEGEEDSDSDIDRDGGRQLANGSARHGGRTASGGSSSEGEGEGDEDEEMEGGGSEEEGGPAGAARSDGECREGSEGSVSVHLAGEEVLRRHAYAPRGAGGIWGRAGLGWLCSGWGVVQVHLLPVPVVV